jgi:RNA polymerase sigma-70 factor (ECF subfamily)
MLAVKRGDVDKLGVLYRRYHARLFSFFCHMNGHTTLSEDLVQDVFFRILKYRASFREGSPFLQWMYQIARNARLQSFNKTRPEAGGGEIKGPGPTVSADSLPYRMFERQQEEAILEQALLELAEDKRELLVLARYQEMAYEDIGQLLGIETGTVKVRVHRAMKELREIFLRLSGVETSCSAKR